MIVGTEVRRFLWWQASLTPVGGSSGITCRRTSSASTGIIYAQDACFVGLADDAGLADDEEETAVEFVQPHIYNE